MTVRPDDGLMVLKSAALLLTVPLATVLLRPAGQKVGRRVKRWWNWQKINHLRKAQRKRRLRSQFRPRLPLLKAISTGLIDYRDIGPKARTAYRETFGDAVPEWRLELDIFWRIMADSLGGELMGKKVSAKIITAYERAAETGRDGRILTRIVTRSLAYYKGRRRKKRIGRNEFKSWPKLWAIQEGGKPAYIELRARYRSPRSMKRASQYAALIGIGVYFYLQDKLQTPPPRGVSWLEQNWLVVVICGGIAYVLGLIAEKLFGLMPGRPLEMTFKGGLIEWRGDEQRQRLFGLDPRKARIRPGEVVQVERVVPHRKAQAEWRKDQERRRKRAEQNKKPTDEPLYFQQASEVVIYTGGEGYARTLGVAEISDDEQGERARRLVAAITTARDTMAGPTKTSGEQATPFEEEVPRRQGLFG